MSRQRIRHFAVALVLSVIVTAASAMPAVARIATPSKASSLSGKGAPAQSVVAAAAAHTSREVFGFALASSLSDPTVGYPSWNFDLLSTVAFFGVHVDSAGRFVGDNGWNVWNSSALTSLVATAHQHGVKVVLTIVLQDFSANTPNMCAGLAQADATVAQTVAEVRAKGVDGVNIDYEGLDGSCGSGDPYWAQHAMTSLTAKMRSALGSSSYLSIDTYSGAAADPYGFFDVVGLANYVDSMFVMAYDMEYSNYRAAPLYCSSFCLGPTSPLTAYRYNDTAVMADYIAAVPAGKVILGVPYYGRKACVGGLGPNEYPTSSVVADSYLDASGEAAYYEVKPGSYLIHREANSSGLERWDTWFNTTLNCTRELYWDDVVSLGKKYDLVNADGLRGVGIWNLNYGGGASELWAALQSHFAACIGAAVTVNPASPQPPGAMVQFAATTSACLSPRYQFWILAPGSSAWTVAQAYSSSATFSWNTAGKAAGTYRYSVWVRDAGSTAAYDSFFPSAAYTLLSPCLSVTAAAAPPTQAAVGTTVGITAAATGCPNPRYEFWTLAPDASSWTLAQAYSSSASFSWNTAGKAAGAYRFSVWARDAASAAAYDAYLPGTPYTLAALCTSATATPSPASPQTVGTAVTITAGASGCTSPRYQFWILAPDSSTWTIAQAYSSTATFSWSTAGRAAGAYRYSVWVRDALSAAGYDAYVPGTAYTLTSPCASATATPSPVSPQAPGAGVTITAGASGCPNPRYEFWILAPGSSAWTIVQAYSSASTFTWNTAGKPAGTYRYSVWVRDVSSTAGYDAYVPGIAYTLAAPCASVSATAAPASPQAHGATITITAVAAGCSNPQYEFWILAPGSSTWQMVQGYSSSATFSWNTTGKPAGTYHYSVWARDGTSGAAYDTYMSALYYLT